MAGSLTLGGMADGLLIGQVTVGPNTVSGKAAISEIINCELAPNTDFVVRVPGEAVQVAGIFTIGGEQVSQVTLRTNLDSGDTGLAMLAQGFFSLPLASGVTELRFRAVSPPDTFQVIFI
jgi:hypothetical protein